MKKDRVMKRLIPQLGEATLESRGDAFTTLARSIVGQQISVKAAQTVWDRFAALPTAMVPAQVLQLKLEDMRAAGLSARKADYLVDLALHFDAGKLHVDGWQGMDDEAIITELVAIRGVGRWTAEMFLIFHLLRPNILPLDDVGLINGISRNYFRATPSAAAMRARWPRPGSLGAAWRLGIFGARWRRCRSRTDPHLSDPVRTAL